MTIAILGGTGPQGQGLALRFARAGIPVALGSRDGKRGAQIAEELNGKLGSVVAKITGTTNEAAIEMAHEMVLLAVPFSAHNATLENIKHLPGS